tara:strand:- start:64 stop:219 length:156 start_codon:yes stop_codon:yes gene_type:complete
MNAKERYDKRRDDLIIKLHGYGCSIDEIVKESRKSVTHVKRILGRYESLGW